MFQSTPRLYGATPTCSTTFLYCSVSIHAPPIRSDGQRCTSTKPLGCFNPRPAYTERPNCTLPNPPFDPCFNPRPAYTERQFQRLPAGHKVTCFNPRPAYTERLYGRIDTMSCLVFQSTPRLYGATNIRGRRPLDKSVSIHAPPIRSDRQRQDQDAAQGSFNPRPAYTERRPTASKSQMLNVGFNPRPAYTERPDTSRSMDTDRCFNPRPAYTERRSRLSTCSLLLCVSIHAPPIRSDVKARYVLFAVAVSIHAPPIRSDSTAPKPR